MNEHDATTMNFVLGAAGVVVAGCGAFSSVAGGYAPLMGMFVALAFTQLIVMTTSLRKIMREVYGSDRCCER